MFESDGGLEDLAQLYLRERHGLECRKPRAGEPVTDTLGVQGDAAAGVGCSGFVAMNPPAEVHRNANVVAYGRV